MANICILCLSDICLMWRCHRFGFIFITV